MRWVSETEEMRKTDGQAPPVAPQFFHFTLSVLLNNRPTGILSRMLYIVEEFWPRGATRIEEISAYHTLYY